MSALAFSRFSKEEPNPWTVPHPGGFVVGYTCHMAAIHWAFMALGKTHAEANRLVGEFARATCPGCTGRGIHGSLAPAEYGRVFCSTAQKVPNRDALHGMVDVGDVLITDNKVWPAHSMVVRQKRGAGHVTVRGFNNHGTLGTGQRDRYDPVSHNITKDKYWRDPARGKFGQVGVDIFVIVSRRYLQVAQVLAHRMLG